MLSKQGELRCEILKKNPEKFKKLIVEERERLTKLGNKLIAIRAPGILIVLYMSRDAQPSSIFVK